MVASRPYTIQVDALHEAAKKANGTCSVVSEELAKTIQNEVAKSIEESHQKLLKDLKHMLRGVVSSLGMEVPDGLASIAAGAGGNKAGFAGVGGGDGKRAVIRRFTPSKISSKASVSKNEHQTILGGLNDVE